MSASSCGCDPEANHVCEWHLQPKISFPQTTEQAIQQFIVKDSGQRTVFDSGMQRDVTTDKTDYSLVADGPMLKRYAEHLTKGAKKYNARNWLKASGQAELDRFRESAFRHFVQWYYGATDEDHASAIWFNVNGAEYVKEKL